MDISNLDTFEVRLKIQDLQLSVTAADSDPGWMGFDVQMQFFSSEEETRCVNEDHYVLTDDFDFLVSPCVDFYTRHERSSRSSVAEGDM